MPQCSKSLIIPFSQKALFELVNDVSSYPSFMPYCQAAEVIEQTPDTLTASLTLKKGSFSQSFTTKNTLYPHEKMVLTLVDGPFKKLEGIWTFEAKGDNITKVSLDLEYTFSSTLLAGMFGRVFHKVANNLVDSFHTRAKEVLS